MHPKFKWVFLCSWSCFYLVLLRWEKKKAASSWGPAEDHLWCEALQVKKLNKEREREAGGWVSELACRVSTLLSVFVRGTRLAQRAERLQRRAEQPAAKTQRALDQWAHSFWQSHSTTGYEQNLEELTTGSRRTKKGNAFEESCDSPHVRIWICKLNENLLFCRCIEFVGVYSQLRDMCYCIGFMKEKSIELCLQTL